MSNEFIQITLPDYSMQRVVTLISRYQEEQMLDENSIPIVKEIKDLFMKRLQEACIARKQSQQKVIFIKVALPQYKIVSIWMMLKTALDENLITEPQEVSNVISVVTYLAATLDEVNKEVQETKASI